MKCWFDNHASGARLQLHHLIERIGVRHPQDLAEGLERIAQAQQRGYWVALVLHYELGAWLEPALASTRWPVDEAGLNGLESSPELLTAWVFEDARHLEISQQPVVGCAKVVTAKPCITKAQYLKMIERIQALIACGEIYQINATFAIAVTTQGDPEALYEQVARGSQVAHAAYLEDGQTGTKILSWSPELFVERHQRKLITRPMKGTAPRVPHDARADQAMGQTLLGSAKDRAENLMIVDLLRNDLGRIATIGSVKVDPLFALERYPTVWTMTSTIEAELKEDLGLLPVLQALFPCGSVTGAPKIAAMRHIRTLEAIPRGVYCGSIGWLAPTGEMSLNVAIRTLVLDRDGQGRYHVGGGIVHDSDPQKEWQECFWKARILGVPIEAESD